MRQVCAAHSGLAKSTCNSLAWTYYQAVKKFGDLRVSEEQIERIRRSVENIEQAAQKLVG
jgi:hypothetical protein